MAMFFSLHYLVAKELLLNVHPFSLACFRGLIAGSVLFILFKTYKNLELFKENLKTISLIAFFGFFINIALFFFGLKNTTAVNASVINNTIPVFATLVAILLGLEKGNIRKLLGIGLGFLTVLGLILFTSEEGLRLNLSGDVLVFLNVLSVAISIALTKKILAKGVPTALITPVTLLIGGFLFLLIGFNHHADFIQFTFSNQKAMLLVFYEVFISTSAIYFLNFELLKRLDASKATAFIYIQPPIIAVLGLILFGIPISYTALPFYVVLIFSVTLIFYNNKRKCEELVTNT